MNLEQKPSLLGLASSPDYRMTYSAETTKLSSSKSRESNLLKVDGELESLGSHPIPGLA